MKRRRLQEVLDAWSYDSAGNRVSRRPKIWATNATQLQFDSRADVALPFHLTYYRALPNLSPAAATNALTSGYPSLLRAVCMAKAYEFLKNQDQKLYWLQVAIGEINEANVGADEELAGTDIEMEVPE